jgi:prephenate dehydrogenase
MNAQRMLGIIGTGLIGSSVALAAKSRGFRVTGFDTNPQALETALERGIIDRAAAREDVYRRSEIVVLAMPVRECVAELEMLDPALLDDVSLVIDVSSVKAPVVDASRGLPKFVATHPMAGSERSGPAFAQASLFEGKTWAYVPARDDVLNRRAAQFIELLGGVPLAVEANEHDVTVALTSHMPQVFAWLFTARLRECGYAHAEELCGPVARELLRIGRSSAASWDDVLDYNALNVARELGAMSDALNEAAYMRNTP